jgi:hypothetical protein
VRIVRIVIETATDFVLSSIVDYPFVRRTLTVLPSGAKQKHMGLVAYFTAMRKTDSDAHARGERSKNVSSKFVSTKMASLRAMPIWSDSETMP